jgi:hypothetical protein
LPSTKQLRFDFLTACYKKIDMEMPADVATETNPSNDTETVDGAAAEEEKQPQPHHQQLQQVRLDEGGERTLERSDI